MPYISQQQKRTVSWDEITSENEQNQSCSVKQPVNLVEGGLTKYNRRSRSDLRKGIKQGLEHDVFKYQYEK
ncbi:MAG: hypothetical protein ACTSPN_01805 [Promethearchaeota archaeon]